MEQVKIYLLALISVILGACSSGFLDSEPTTELTDVNFYRTTRDAELAIVGCYDGLQILYSDGFYFPVAAEVLSDNCFGGTGHTDGFGFQQVDEFDFSRSPADVNQFEKNWTLYYQAIYRCNVLLQKMGQIDWEGDTTLMRSVEAQARFIRAYCYFDMVRLWEKVPLLTEPSNANIPQAEPDSTYAVIAQDLLFAAHNGTETVSAGRVNKWNAKAFLARVYLFYTGYYGKTDLAGMVTKAQALQGLEDVIASGNYSLIEEYKDLWPAASSSPDEAGAALTTTYAGKDNDETVFAIKYNITSDYDGNTDGNHWLVMLGFRNQTFSPYGKGWGACPVDPRLYNAYENGDDRRDASIIGIAEEGIDYDISGQREYTGYMNKKYITMANPDGTDVAEANGAVNFQIGQFQDYVVMRYADVLLMAAELGSTNAQSYFDQVRARAGLSTRPVNQANIMNERRFEFAFEGLRYYDLLRQGVETAASAIALSTTVLNGGISATKTITAGNITKTRGFQMIPENQINLANGVLIQNPGWE